MSSKKEIMDNLINPLVSIYGDFTEGHIEWLLENCQKYTLTQLQLGADKLIRTCERFPYPATIINAIQPPLSRMASPAGG